MSNNDSPVLVITGASSGIGAATARVMASAGYRLVLAARSGDKLKVLQKELGGADRVLTVACDVQQVADQQGMVDAPFFDESPDNALQPEDIAGAVKYALEQPAHVDVNELLVRPTPKA